MRKRIVLGVCALALVCVMGMFVGCVAAGTHPLNCPGGTRWSDRYQRCETVAQTCPAGYEWFYNQCKAICRNGKQWDALTSSCECPDDSVWVGDANACVDRDELATVREKIAQQRTDRRAYHAHQASKCPEGMKYVPVPQNSLLGPCFSVCDDGAHWDSTVKRCVSDQQD